MDRRDWIFLGLVFGILVLVVVLIAMSGVKATGVGDTPPGQNCYDTGQGYFACV